MIPVTNSSLLRTTTSNPIPVDAITKGRKPSNPKTREEWLNKLGKALIPHFKAAGYTIPENIRYSCSFTSNGARGKAIGECWTSKVSGDKTFEIFITPKLEDPLKVAGVLVHEIVHATVGIEAGHGKIFRDCAIAVGLTGKMTATSETDELIKKLHTLIMTKVGEYPHAQLNAALPKQKTRMIKVECEDSCGFIFRASNAAIMRNGGDMTCPSCQAESMTVYW